MHELISQRDIENKLRNVFGTKVTCKQRKDGVGQITIDFYSKKNLKDYLNYLISLKNLIIKILFISFLFSVSTFSQTADTLKSDASLSDSGLSCKNLQWEHFLEVL